MTDRHAGQHARDRGTAVFHGLVAAAIATIALRLVTGLSLAPLALISLLVFAIVAILRLRTLRMA